MPGRQVVTTPCKLNLHLGVHVEKDERGYHRVDSVMLPVEPTDSLVVEDADELIVRHEPALAVPAEKTTAYRAARLLGEALGVRPDVSISIVDRIPERAGLGGSSADAAAVLRALALRWDVDPLDSRVVETARRVGADVAFFLNPVPSLMVGAGDVLAETFPELVGLPVVLVMPRTEGGVTSECYAEFDREPEEAADYEPLCAALRAGDAGGVAAHLTNNLAPAAKRLAPVVGEAEAWLLSREGVVAGQVTGSGACSFAICESEGAARRIARSADIERGWWSKAVLTVGLDSIFC